MTRSAEELRQVDALVAEAMGYKKGSFPMWNPSTDWSAAGQVVEWIVAQGKFFFELYNDALGCSLDLIPIQLEDEADFVCGDRAPTGPLAICLAFLKAMGVEVPSE